MHTDGEPRGLRDLELLEVGVTYALQSLSLGKPYPAGVATASVRLPSHKPPAQPLPSQHVSVFHPGTTNGLVRRRQRAKKEEPLGSTSAAHPLQPAHAPERPSASHAHQIRSQEREGCLRKNLRAGDVAPLVVHLLHLALKIAALIAVLDQHSASRK